MKKSSLLILSVLFFVMSNKGKAQNTHTDENIPRVRVGVKIGVPNILGGNLEIVTPLFGNRIAPYVDYAAFTIDADDSENELNYFEIGSNIYFNSLGKGMYASLSYSRFNADSFLEGERTIEGQLFTGTASGEVEVNTFNVKLGAKLGRKFYFRVEAGYGFGNVPQQIRITGNVNGEPGVGIATIPDIPGVSDNGLLIATIGFGYSF